MPAALKERLAREVAARGSNLNDVAVEILASRYGRHDMADNAARIESFLQELEERLTAAETAVPDTAPALPEASPVVPDRPPAD